MSVTRKPGGEDEDEDEDDGRDPVTHSLSMPSILTISFVIMGDDSGAIEREFPSNRKYKLDIYKAW